MVDEHEPHEPSHQESFGRHREMSKDGEDSDMTLSDVRYKAFIESIADGVYETDPHGNFTYFNDSLCKIFGYPREEIQGRNFSAFMDKQNSRKAYSAFTKVWVTHRGFTDIIWEILAKNGEKRIIELSAQLIEDVGNKKTGFRGIARDVTERFRSQEALRESELRYQRQYEASKRAELRYRTLLDFVPYPIAVFRLDGRVYYLNPAFTQTFGWSLEELVGKEIPFVPEELRREAAECVRRLLKEKTIQHYETKRLTKDGRILDVTMRGAAYSEIGDEPAGELVILRDVTKERRIARNNEALLRIGMALPRYPGLGDLLDYISSEIKALINAGGAIVILHDEQKHELLFQGAAYDDSATQKRAKQIRFPADNTIAGKVIKTGEAVIIDDTSKDPNFHPVVDERLDFPTHNMLEVPLRSSDRIIGVLCALNKKEGVFDQTDVELLNMIAGTVALSIENARFSEELKEAYREVTSLNRAKDKVINHLSHELKTPVSVLLGSQNILEKRLAGLPKETWQPTLERSKRNLDRILEIQYQVEDIMENKEHKAHPLLTLLLDVCADELESLAAEAVGEGPLVERIRKRIDEQFGPVKANITDIRLHEFAKDRLKVLAPKFAHRRVEMALDSESVPEICIPEEVLRKVYDGLVKNAIENTPDGGKVEIKVRKKGEGSELVVQDYGIGITEENQIRIFEGFFTTQETLSYSSKRPFDFNAGGKGADLLRMKIFSERYGFKINMFSSRCKYIPEESDSCPGNVDACSFCETVEDCYESGGTTVQVFFPPVPARGCSLDEKV